MRSVGTSVRAGRQVPGARKVAIILTLTMLVGPSSLRIETNRTFTIARDAGSIIIPIV